MVAVVQRKCWMLTKNCFLLFPHPATSEKLVMKWPMALTHSPASQLWSRPITRASSGKFLHEVLVFERQWSYPPSSLICKSSFCFLSQVSKGLSTFLFYSHNEARCSVAHGRAAVVNWNTYQIGYVDPTANWDIAGVNVNFCMLRPLSVEEKHTQRLPLKNNLVGSRLPPRLSPHTSLARFPWIKRLRQCDLFKWAQYGNL